MRFFITGILIVQLTLSTVFAESTTYQEGIIDGISRHQIVEIFRHGFIVDHVSHNRANVYIPNHKTHILDSMKLHYRLLSQNRLQKSVEGYPSVSQIDKKLQSFESDFSDICQLFDIGKSDEGRPLYFVKISDHVAREEDEPEVKYIASMHGDEPIGAMLCINLIEYLLSNYQQDAMITELIDNLEIWIMPLMNPDGYVHQRRFNMQGIDLNRNFPDRVNDSNNTTEGRAIEVQHVMNWEFLHSSVLSANFHSGEAVVNYPYDSDFNPYSTYSPTPDNNLFREMSLSYASLNPVIRNNTEFESGITNGVEWYMVYGGMQDWSYEWMGCMEVTIELYQEKWPVYSKISQLWTYNKDAMLNYLTWAQKGIRGVVTDSITGLPIEATIQIEGNDFQVYTDPDVGDYHRILLPGIYNLIVSADGYVTTCQTEIQVSDGYATRQDIKLMPDLDVSIAEIIKMLKVLSSVSGKEPIRYVDINHDGQLGLSDVIWIMDLIAHSIH